MVMNKKHVFVVGGRENNIPRWARAAFEIEHVDREEGKGKFEPTQPPDAIVVNVDFVSHQYSEQAHEHGKAHKVPVLHARSGWSTAVQEAARIGLDWFVRSVQAAGRALTNEHLQEAQEVEAAVDNAWEQAALYERERAKAAEKRLAKERAAREALEGKLAKIRSGAEKRVMEVIQRRATELRVMAERRDAEIKTRIARLATAAQAAVAEAQEAARKAHEALQAVDAAAVAAGAELSLPAELPGGVDSPG